MKLKSIFSVPQSYKKQIKDYSLKDLFFVFLIYFLYLCAMFFSGLIIKKFPNINTIYMGTTINILFVLLVLLILKIKKEKLSSLGLQGGYLKLSLILGITLSIILFFCNCLSNIIFEEQKFISLPKIIENIFYFLSVGLCEEILFRGYILTRLHSITKKIMLDIIITGILFVFMHFPFRMIIYNLSFINFICNYPYIIDLFITHCILTFIRIRSDNIYGSILPHWISDFSYSIVSHI